MRDHIPLRFVVAISLDDKTCSVPQFIGALLYNFENIDLGIKLSSSLALNGLVNPSETLIFTAESLHHSWPPHIEESQISSKQSLRLVF